MRQARRIVLVLWLCGGLLGGTVLSKVTQPIWGSEGVSAKDPTEVAVAAQLNDDTFTQRVTMVVENSTPEEVAPDAANDDSQPVRWTSSTVIPYAIHNVSIDLGDWVDADLLETAQASSSVYTWDSPVLFQVLRELRQMREACR